MNGKPMSRTSKRFLARARRVLLKPLRRFSHHQHGAAAVEFALVALPFFALLFAIIQTAIVLFATQVLETAVADSARLVLTGQAQNGGFSQTSFKTAVCGRISSMFNCTTGLYVDVRTFTNFTTISMNSPTDSSGNVVNNFVYQPGGPGLRISSHAPRRDAAYEIGSSVVDLIFSIAKRDVTFFNGTPAISRL